MRPILTILIVALVISSCNQPGCTNNSNEILSTKDKNSWAYQHELMRLIDENQSKMEYYFERRVSIDSESYIVMNCYGPDFCGELKTKFVPKNLQSIKLQNEGWKGAQLIGVGFGRVKKADGHEVFAFEKLDEIID